MMWFAELVERNATQINAESPAYSNPLHHACVASASDVNKQLLDEKTSRIEAVSTYVQNTMSGMYKSGAGFDIVPPCLVRRASRHTLRHLTLLLADVVAERFFIRQHAHHQPKRYY